jgi:hypothetical protein
MKFGQLGRVGDRNKRIEKKTRLKMERTRKKAKEKFSVIYFT